MTKILCVDGPNKGESYNVVKGAPYIEFASRPALDLNKQAWDDFSTPNPIPIYRYRISWATRYAYYIGDS